MYIAVLYCAVFIRLKYFLCFQLVPATSQAVYVDNEPGSALVLTIKSTQISACSSGSLVSKGRFQGQECLAYMCRLYVYMIMYIFDISTNYNDRLFIMNVLQLLIVCVWVQINIHNMIISMAGNSDKSESRI